MTPDTLDDDRLGVPGVFRPTPPSPPPPTHPASPSVETPPPDVEPVIRPGETDLGRPEHVPENVAPLSDADRAKLRQAEEEQALRDLTEAEELTASDPAVAWFGWFAHPLAAAFLIGAAGALGLFVYSQTLDVLDKLAKLEPVFQYLGYAGLVLCGGAVLYSAGRFLLVYVRLRRNRQLRLAGLEELHQRTRLRWLAHAKAAEARQRLEQYLREFPIGTSRQLKKLANVGLGAERVEELKKVRDELLDPAKFTGTGEWFERFRTGFQKTLDAAASERIGYWSRRSGITTAMAPNGLIDSAAMLYFGFALLADLCEVYNLRTGKTGTAVLLGRVFFNSYLSGQLTEWEKLTEEQLNHLMTPTGPLAELTAARVLSKVGAKATTGLLNYFLLSRLGRYACRLLRPVG